MTARVAPLVFLHDHFAYRGGGEQMLLRVARLAAEEGPVELVLGWAEDEGVLTAEERALFRGVTLARFPHALRLRGWAAHRAGMRRLREAARTSSGLLAFSLRTAVRAARVARSEGTRLAWMCQQSFPLFLPPLAGLKEVIGLARLRGARARIACISDEAVAGFGLRGFRPAQLRLVRNGIDVPRFAACASRRAEGLDLRRRAGLEHADLVVVVVARLDPLKNYAGALEALALARDAGCRVGLLAVGGPMPHATDEPERLRALATRLGVEAQVCWAGEVSDTRPWLAAADVALLPSHKEAAGLVLAEAGAAGLPLLGNRRGGIPEIVRDGVTGCLFDGDPAELARHLVALAGDPALRARLSHGARDLVEREFNAALQDERWRALLRELRGGWSEHSPELGQPAGGGR